MHASAQSPKFLNMLFRAGNDNGVKPEQEPGQRRDDGPENNTAVKNRWFSRDGGGRGYDGIHVKCVYCGARQKTTTIYEILRSQRLASSLSANRDRNDYFDLIILPNQFGLSVISVRPLAGDPNIEN